MGYDLKLKEMRKRAGMTQKKAAEALGVTVGGWSGWEIGRRKISLDDACRICDVLGCTLDELAGRAAPTLSEDETLLLASFRECDDRGKRVVMRNAIIERGADRLSPESIAQ